MAPNRDNDPDKRKRTSFLGLMFNPEFGQSFGALKESWAIFGRTILLLFVSVRIIPPDDPYVLGKDPVSLEKIIRRGWDNIVWDKNHIPQIVMFCGIIFGFALILGLILATVYMLMKQHGRH